MITIRPQGNVPGRAGPSEKGGLLADHVAQPSVETSTVPGAGVRTQIVQGGVPHATPNPSCFAYSSSACVQLLAIVQRRAVFWLDHWGLLPIMASVLLIVPHDASEITVRMRMAICTSIMLNPPWARSPVRARRSGPILPGRSLTGPPPSCPSWVE